MKITPQQYAQSLYETTKNKSQDEIGGVVGNFVKILGKNNQLKLKNKIIEKFGAIYNRENGIVEAQVTSREKLTEELRTMVRTKIHTQYGAKEVVLVEKIDANIGGGVIIRVGDEILDGSVERRLKELKKVISK